MGLPGVLIGIGLGGFVDGIVLHQLLQWHHMVSHTEPMDTVLGLERNTLADGLFHAAAWLAVTAGVAVLASRPAPGVRPWATRVLWGWALMGWGMFNLVEGVVDHHLLELHHVRDDLDAPLAWDLAFLGFGALLVVAGWLLVGSAARAAPGSRSGRSSGWSRARPGSTG